MSARFRHRGPKVVEEDTTLRLFDAMGAEMSEIYGHGDGRGGDRHVLDMTVQIIDDALQEAGQRYPHRPERPDVVCHSVAHRWNLENGSRA